MHPTFSKVLVAALVFGAAHALPQPEALDPRAAAPSSTPNPVGGGNENDDLIAELKTEPSTIKRYKKLLLDDKGQLLSDADLAKATVYDFNKGAIPVPATNGGFNSMASLETFPILTNSGLIVNLVNLGPCGVFLPHVHPRANEFFTVIEGEVDFGYMLEIGLLDPPAPNPEIGGKLTKYMGTIFPQGSVHYQINNSPDCKQAVAVVSLSNEDPGSTAILQMPSGGNATVNARRQIDMEDVEDFRAVLPNQIVSVVDSCLARCNK